MFITFLIRYNYMYVFKYNKFIGLGHILSNELISAYLYLNCRTNGKRQWIIINFDTNPTFIAIFYNFKGHLRFCSEI